jgi:hypothetical protein
MKDSFYEEPERVLGQFPKYHMKILYDFNAKLGTEDTFKPTMGNENSPEINNDNDVRVVNFITSKTVKSTTFPHHNIHKYTWTSTGGKELKQIYHILTYKDCIQM